MQNQLIIFIKNPLLGRVKTRLAKSIGNEKALAVYRDLLNQCRAMTLSVRAEKHLFYSDYIEEDEWDEADFNKAIQIGDTLGDRMQNAIQEIHEKESGKIVLIGSDCYDLTAAHIEKAFELLEEHELVFGPANDGGYYLIAMQRPIVELFQNISWSTSSVLAESLAVCKKENLNYALLEELVDLDTFEDLKKSGYILKDN